ncbi:MAG: family F420-dependent class oxidoreductase [Glaciihabitans sp.]|jgi:F420-dependent oxidoreductase-like protein|nr:family F420-dependent class oxidoreductase [Glaciihabitans sp.]
MKLAIHFPNFTMPGEPSSLATLLAATAKAADEGGCETMTLMDHWFQMEQRAPATDPMLEGYTSLGFIAAHTKRLKLGLLVTGVTYRYPGLLAKTVATLDVLSEGRAFLGIGAAWYEREHLALGVPYPPISTRFEMLEEAIQICEQMWSDDEGPYNGKHYQLAETICRPRPIQAPRPPILVGGSGEQKTLRLVAKYADACNLFDLGEDVIAHKLDVLDQHCEDLGRDPASIQRTMLAAPGALDDVDGFLKKMERAAKLGISQIWIAATSPDPAGFVSRLTEVVLPRLSQI